MERELASWSLKEKEEEIFFQSEQDGLFFGLEFLNHLISLKNNFKITAFLKDGDCLFKGQTLLGIHLKDNSFQKEDILSALSYFSGAYTLVSCFVERQWDFAIAGSSSPDFVYPEWEEKAILKAGGLVKKVPEKMSSSKKEILQKLEKGETQIFFNSLKTSSQELKKILQTFSNIKFSLYGSFWPEDLEYFRNNNNISSIHPLCLQGFFPCLKMKLV